MRITRCISLFMLLLLPSLAWSATYYVRYDGTVAAANKATATSCASAGTALSMTTHNAVTTFAAGDMT